MELRTKRIERTVAEYYQSVGMSDCENAGLPEMVLTPADIPGADLSEPYESHSVLHLHLENVVSKLDGKV